MALPPSKCTFTLLHLAQILMSWHSCNLKYNPTKSSSNWKYPMECSASVQCNIYKCTHIRIYICMCVCQFNTLHRSCSRYFVTSRKVLGSSPD
jgi:hypothetical protein